MRITCRLVVWGVLVAAAIAAPFSARADGLAEREQAARAAAEQLSASDEAVRRAALKRLVALETLGAAELAKRVADLDDRTWTECAAAFVEAKCSYCALPLVLAARSAAPAQAQRLLALARALNPRAGVARTPEETAAEVRRLLDASGRARCGTGYAEDIALLGHDALEPLLDTLRAGDPASPGDSIACWAVAMLAEQDDLPALRQLLLAGKLNLAGAIDRMQAAGVPGATDALLAAAAAGRLDRPVTDALAHAPDKDRVTHAVEEILVAHPELAEGHRVSLTFLFVDLDDRAAVPRLEAWAGTSREPYELRVMAHALVHFGRAKGVGLLVKIAGERRTRFPCRPSTPEEEAAAGAPGRLCPEGFDVSDRERAARRLSAIAGKEVFDVPEDLYRWLRAQGPDHESEGDFLDRAAAAFRTWWEASKDTLRFDAATGRWLVGT